MNPGLLQIAVLLGSLLYPGEVSSFVLKQPSSSTCTSTPTALFLAKVKAKKNKNNSKGSGAATGGGFGKVAAKTDDQSKPRPDDDYAIFPALEPQVRQTLESTPPAMTEDIESNGSLPMEIYDRLDQIYGFPDFNYEQSPWGEESNDSDDGESFSLEDLMAAPSSSPDISKTNGTPKGNTQGTLDLNELLAAATGGPVDTLPTMDSNDSSRDESSAAEKEEMRNAISSLPSFEKINVLHLDPLVITVDDFFTEEVSNTNHGPLLHLVTFEKTQKLRFFCCSPNLVFL